MNNHPTFVRFIGVFLIMAASGCGGNDVEPTSADDLNEEEVLSVSLTAEEIQELDLQTVPASYGTLELTQSFPGEVMVNQDRYVHIVPRVKGIVESVAFSEGDRVTSGEVLAILDSRELADIKSDYLASVERADIAEQTFEREKGLLEQGISSESEFLDARQGVTEAMIALRSSTQKLLSLGFSEEYISELPKQPDHALVHYELIAPMSGLVLERHISQGESVDDENDAFAIADLSDVWIDLSIFQEQLDSVREGQKAIITSTGNRLSAEGQIKFLRSTLGEETRTAVARLVLDNTSGRWRPGMFVNGDITVDEIEINILVERSAIITHDGIDVVFIQEDDRFVAQPVVTDRVNDTHVEIVSGLTAGQIYVSHGAFTLKAELAKSELSDDHSH